jgi:hypothetical protein
MRLTALAVAVFAAYLVLAARAGRRSATTRDGRRAISTWLLYTMTVIGAIGALQQIELWPFSAWPLVAANAGPRTQLSRMVAVGRSGHEYDIDYRVWQPLIVEELIAWSTGRLRTLPPASRDDAGRYLLAVVERGASEVGSRRPPGHLDRWLGPLAAPSFLLHPRIWNTPRDVPPEPLIGLRLYRESWDIEARARGDNTMERTLLYEYVRR